MKDLSFLLLKNSLAFKMKKGIKNLCTGDASTSTLNQQNEFDHHPHHQKPTQTLEEMIMQLDLEEKMAAAARPSFQIQHRMSCVNSSDILRSARNALNQYPRFSLDGKDAMYRSSFRNPPFDHHHHHRRHASCRPAKVAGERVIWCKPGVVGKLMGLEAIPIPLIRVNSKSDHALLRKQNLKRSSEKHEKGWRMTNHGGGGGGGGGGGSCSRATGTGYCVDSYNSSKLAQASLSLNYTLL